MVRPRRLGALFLLTASLVVVAACAPPAYGWPLSGNASNRTPIVEVGGNPFVCQAQPTDGHLHVEFTSTSGADPTAVTVHFEGTDIQSMAGPVDHHWETTYLFSLPAGRCDYVDIVVACSTPCPEWEASNQNYSWKVSVVP